MENCGQRLKCPEALSQRDAEKVAFGNENVNNSIAGQNPKKTIFVPNRLINFVI